MIFQCHLSTLIWTCCHLYTWILHLVTCVALFLGSILFRGCLINGLIINIITCVILNNMITIIMIIMIIIFFPWRGSWSSNAIWALRTKSLPDQPLDLAFGDMRLSVFAMEYYCIYNNNHYYYLISIPWRGSWYSNVIWALRFKCLAISTLGFSIWWQVSTCF